MIEFQGVDTKWQEEEDKILENIKFKFGAGDHVAVIGRVGSGKSTLLLTVLQETIVTKGVVKLQKGIKMAYTAQEPLIVTGTIRENIVFGRTFDQEWYDKVTWACCL